MGSRENETEYLRLLADLLVEKLVDDSKVGGHAIDEENIRNSSSSQRSWPSHSCRHLLRELTLSTILLPLMDFVADPDTLNQLILSSLGSSSETIEQGE